MRWVRLVALGAVLAACTSPGHGVGAGDTTVTTSPSTSVASSTTGTSTTGTSAVPEPDEAGGPPVALAQPASQFPTPPAATCGIDRQRVKTGEDVDAPKVDLTKQLPTTIAALVALHAPAQPVSRVPGVEDTVYQLSATLTGYKLETDSDYHLVVADAQGRTMIVEIPAPDCVTGGPFKPAITTARAAFDGRFHPTPAFQKLPVPVPVSVTGVGFFDRIHGQTGVAPNGIELHPVLTLAIG